MPLLHHAVTRAFRGDREPEQLPRQANREVADVDHLLDLAESLGADLAGLDRHQRPEVGLVFTQQAAQLADEQAADRGRHLAPRLEGFPSRAQGGLHLLGGVRAQASQGRPGDRRAGDQVTVRGQRPHAEPLKDGVGLRGQVVRVGHGVHAGPHSFFGCLVVGDQALAGVSSTIAAPSFFPSSVTPLRQARKEIWRRGGRASHGRRSRAIAGTM
jgi:hypothetical protein